MIGKGDALPGSSKSRSINRPYSLRFHSRPGLELGMMGMRINSERCITIPPHLGPGAKALIVGKSFHNPARNLSQNNTYITNHYNIECMLLGFM